MNKTFLSLLIIILGTFSILTIYKMKDYPKTGCCKDLKNPDNTACQMCENYSLPEKIIYVWKYS